MTTANSITVVDTSKLFCGDITLTYGGLAQNVQNDIGVCNNSIHTGDHAQTGFLGNVGNVSFYPYPNWWQEYYQQPYLNVWPLASSHTYVDFSWRADVSKGDRIVLSVDVPGVALDDIEVNIDAYTIRVIGKRSDTGANITHSYTLPQCYDTKAITAKLEHGVLTLVVKKLANMKPRKVTVKGA